MRESLIEWFGENSYNSAENVNEIGWVEDSTYFV